MSNVIEFPGRKKDTFDQALEYFKSAYSKAGLNHDQVSLAIGELEPILRESFPRKEFVFNLSGDLDFTESQIEAITEEHNRCMQEAISYFGEQMWLSLCNLAGVIGRKVQENA
jgi:hypothetical protein